MKSKILLTGLGVAAFAGSTEGRLLQGNAGGSNDGNVVVNAKAADLGKPVDGLVLEANRVEGIYSTIAGGTNSIVHGNVRFGTVSGGFQNTVSRIGATISGGVENLAVGENAAISGGSGNNATAPGTVIGGGLSNEAGGWISTISGGKDNKTPSVGATVGGGESNLALGSYATIAGGQSNMASDHGATVVGGVSNEARNPLTFAAGHHALAHQHHSGVFGFQSLQDPECQSQGPNTLTACVPNGLWVREANGEYMNIVQTISTTAKTLQTSIDTVDGKIEELKEQVEEELVPFITEFDDFSNETLDKFEEMEQILHDFQSSMTKSNEKIESLEASLADLEETQKELNGVFLDKDLAHDQSLQSLETKVATLESQLSTMTACECKTDPNSSLEGELAAIKAQLSKSSPDLLLCPEGTTFVGFNDNKMDIPGCGLERCEARYGLTMEQCFNKCKNHAMCNHFSFATPGGDKNVPVSFGSTCTIYNVLPTTRFQYWGPNQIMCKVKN